MERGDESERVHRFLERNRCVEVVVMGVTALSGCLDLACLPTHEFFDPSCHSRHLVRMSSKTLRIRVTRPVTYPDPTVIIVLTRRIAASAAAAWASDLRRTG
jgi:hypothetical protein